MSFEELMKKRAGLPGDTSKKPIKKSTSKQHTTKSNIQKVETNSNIQSIENDYAAMCENYKLLEANFFEKEHELDLQKDNIDKLLIDIERLKAKPSTIEFNPLVDMDKFLLFIQSLDDSVHPSVGGTIRRIKKYKRYGFISQTAILLILFLKQREG